MEIADRMFELQVGAKCINNKQRGEFCSHSKDVETTCIIITVSNQLYIELCNIERRILLCSYLKSSCGAG